MKVIITIPAFNEEKTIGKTIKEIKEVMQKTPHYHEILVIDDGSRDRTIRVAKEAGAIVYNNRRNCGLAETFKHEMQRCKEHKADIIIHTDADGQYPAGYIPALIQKLQEGNDLVLGTRFGKGKYKGSLMKKLGNIAFAKTFSKLLKKRITDTTTGFRAFTPEVAKLPIISSFTYTQEQLLRAGRKKMRITEVPIKARKTRESKLFRNSFDYAIKAWITILRLYRDFTPLRFFGTMGLITMTPGAIIGFYFIYLHLTTGITGHLGLLFLMIILLLTGLQITLFGFLADMQRR
jgi:glycosyltransferase involved in cell wall biosynthesis